MIDLSLSEMLEIAREAELQRQLEADGVAPAEGKPVTMPEDLRGKLGEAIERQSDGTPPDPCIRRP
jgi:hypothetical protein